MVYPTKCLYANAPVKYATVGLAIFILVKVKFVKVKKEWTNVRGLISALFLFATQVQHWFGVINRYSYVALHSR